MAIASLPASGCGAWPPSSLPPVTLHLSSASVLWQSAGIFLPVRRLVAVKNVAETGQMVKILGIQSSASLLTGIASDVNLKRLEGIKLCDPSGTSVPLVALWEKRVAVVAFARHFGCLLCRKRADLLQSRKGEMDAAGVSLILIAPGTSEQARVFLEQTKFSGEVYADPEHASYDALEFVKGVSSVLNPKSGSRVARAFKEGYKNDWKLSFYQDTMKRGGWQQGGIIVAGPGTSTLRYMFKDAEAGDEPQLDDVISACCSH